MQMLQCLNAWHLDIVNLLFFISGLLYTNILKFKTIYDINNMMLNLGGIKMAKEKKAKRPVDKKKLLQNIIILIIVGAMILSVAATLIYYLMAL